MPGSKPSGTDLAQTRPAPAPRRSPARVVVRSRCPSGATATRRQCPQNGREKWLYTIAERAPKIMALSSDIPSIWHAEGTTNADRKEIIRCLIERVVVHVEHDSEYVDATIHWSGGFTSQHEFIRSVNSYATLQDFDAMMRRIAESARARPDDSGDRRSPQRGRIYAP